MNRIQMVFVCVFAVALGACGPDDLSGEDSSDTNGDSALRNGRSDGGRNLDGGTHIDAGTRADGGIRADGGTHAADGGIHPDGGIPSDAGTPMTCGDTTWANYGANFFKHYCNGCHVATYTSIAKVSHDPRVLATIKSGSMPEGGLNAEEKQKILSWFDCGMP